MMSLPSLAASPPISDLIDPGDGPQVFSHFRLVKGYTGFCRRVRRASDNATLDVGFTAGGLYNLRAELDWAAGANTTVDRIYNQNPQPGQPAYMEASGAAIQAITSSTAASFGGFPAMRMGSTSTLADPSLIQPVFFEEFLSVIWIGQVTTQSGAQLWSINADGAAAQHASDTSGTVYDYGPYDWGSSPIPYKKWTHSGGAGAFAQRTMAVTTYETASPWAMTAWTNGTAVSVLDIDDTKPAAVDYLYDGPLRLFAAGGGLVHTWIVDGSGAKTVATLAKASFNARGWIY